MLKQVRRTAGMGLIALGLGLMHSGAVAQSAGAVPKLDLNRFVGVWYEMARLPNKMEKRCKQNDTILYALGTKDGTFQMGIFCKVKPDLSNEWDANGKMDKSGDGRLKVTHLWPFHKKFWVLATGPAYEWALVGSPNHKTLWLLSRSAEMSPAVLAQIEASASAARFDTAKLIPVPQHRQETMVSGN